MTYDSVSPNSPHPIVCSWAAQLIYSGDLTVCFYACQSRQQPAFSTAHKNHIQAMLVVLSRSICYKPGILSMRTRKQSNKTVCIVNIVLRAPLWIHLHLQAMTMRLFMNIRHKSRGFYIGGHVDLMGLLVHTTMLISNTIYILTIIIGVALGYRRLHYQQCSVSSQNGVVYC